ncbi:coiled-coil domain-containing protein 42 homolog [Carcharodon carcharias]|uniref:coiled-coil domain-containing protein 42 homolog n=1 Tax=Carcharodon carcharias TaxID=13397 RepID=UPI001B7F5CCE|nr:coiled-coil domain-containing protein 42 homolog [Carcharodon carcharias]
MPKQESCPLTTANALLEKRRELADVEAALADQKEDFQMKMKILQQRREDLKEKEEELKQSLLKFDKFLEENDAKQNRVKNKIITETELVKQKEKDIIRFEAELKVLIDKREQLKKKVESYSIYPKFLEKVIKISNEFQDIRMVNTHFETLLGTHDLLITKYQEDQEVMKTIKSNHNQFMMEKNNDIMMYHNSLAVLKTRLDEAKAKTIKGESLWVHIQNTAAKRTLILGMTKMAIFNLYMHIRKAGIQPGTVSEDTNMQLQAIQHYILELSDIVHDLKRHLEFGSSSVAPTL